MFKNTTQFQSSDFPLSVEMLLNVLEVIAPFKHFSKLRDFITFKLPNGFPVKVEIPILPTVTAKITFQQFEFRDDIPAELFRTPKDYVEDPTRFPDLWRPELLNVFELSYMCKPQFITKVGICVLPWFYQLFIKWSLLFHSSK